MPHKDKLTASGPSRPSGVGSSSSTSRAAWSPVTSVRRSSIANPALVVDQAGPTTSASPTASPTASRGTPKASAGPLESSTVPSASTAIQQRPPLSASGPTKSTTVTSSVVRDRALDGRTTPLRADPAAPSYPRLASPVTLTHNAGPNRSLSVRSQVSEGNTTDMSSPSPSLTGAARMSRGWEETSTPSLGRSGSSASASTTPTSPEEEPAVPTVPTGYKGKQRRSIERYQRETGQGGVERPSHLEYDAPMTDALRWPEPAAQQVENTRRSTPPEATQDMPESAQPSMPSRPSFRSALSHGSKYFRPSTLFPTTPPRPSRASRTSSSAASSSSGTLRERPQEEEVVQAESSASTTDVTPPRSRSPFLLRRKSRSKSSLRSSDDPPPPLPEGAASRASSSLAAPLLGPQVKESIPQSRNYLTRDTSTTSLLDRPVPAPSRRSSSMMASWIRVEEETSGDQSSVLETSSTVASIDTSGSGDAEASSRTSTMQDRSNRPSFVGSRSRSVVNLLSFGGSTGGGSEMPLATQRRDGLLQPPLMDSPDDLRSTIPLPSGELTDQPLLAKRPASSKRTSSRWTDRLPRILGNKSSPHPSVVDSLEAERPNICVASSGSRLSVMPSDGVDTQGQSDKDSSTPLRSVDAETKRSGSKSRPSGMPRQRKSSAASSSSRQTPLSPEMASLWLAAEKREDEQQTALAPVSATDNEDEQVTEAAVMDDELAELAPPRRPRTNSLSRALSIMFDPRPALDDVAPDVPHNAQVTASSAKAQASSSQHKTPDARRRISNEQGRRAVVSKKPSQSSTGSGGSKTIKASSSTGSSTSTGSRSTPEKAGRPGLASRRKASPTRLESSSGASSQPVEKAKAPRAAALSKSLPESNTSVGGAPNKVEAIDPAAVPRRRQTTAEHATQRSHLSTLASSSPPNSKEDGSELRQRRAQSLSITPQSQQLRNKKGKRSSTASRLTGFPEELSKTVAGGSGDRGNTSSRAATLQPSLQMNDLSDQAFLEVLTAARKHYQEVTAREHEEEERIQRLTELGMGPAARRGAADRPVATGSAVSRTSTGERRSSGTIKRSSSADGRLDGTKHSDILGSMSHSSSERALRAGEEPRSPVRAFIADATNDEEWAHEVKASFIIRELLETEQSYARHLESLLVAVRKKATVGGVTRSAPPSGASSFTSSSRRASMTASSSSSQQFGNSSTSAGLDRSLPLLRSLLPQLIAVSHSLAARINGNASAEGVGAAFSILADQLDKTFVAWSTSANEIMSGLRATQGSKSKVKERLVLTPTIDTDVSVFRTATNQQRPDSSGSQGRLSLSDANLQSRVPSSSKSPSINEEESIDEDPPVPPRSGNISRSSTHWSFTAYTTTKSRVTAVMNASSSSASMTVSTSSSNLTAMASSKRRMSASPSAHDLSPIADSPSSDPSRSKTNRSSSSKPKTPAPTPQQQPRPKTLTALDVAIMPMQRVPRYLLLLAALESNVPERSVCHARVVKSLETMRAIAKKCDDAAKMG